MLSLMFPYDFWDMHVQNSVTNIKVTCNNNMFFIEKFGAVFIKDFLEMIDFIIESLEILASCGNVGSYQIKELKL